MIPSLRKLSVIDIALILALLVLMVNVYSVSGANATAEQEKARLEIRAKAAELNFSELEKESNLESLRQSLEQAKSALAENPLPTEAEAIATTDQIMQYAEENNVHIAKWQSSHTGVNLKGENYPALKHSLNTRSETSALIGFIEDLTRSSVVPVVQNMNISRGKESELMWETSLELLIYYR